MKIDSSIDRAHRPQWNTSKQKRTVILAGMLVCWLPAQALLGDLPAPELPPNTLSSLEKAAGWKLLWNGLTTDGWQSPRSTTFPTNGWEIANGVLTVRGTSVTRGEGGGNIMTRSRFSNFELCADFKLTPGANSGIKYFVQSRLDQTNTALPGTGVGCEFQILDDERHPDAKLGRNGNRRLGALYDLLPAMDSKKANPIGEWNSARILARGKHVEHWLNGRKVLEYERGSADFRSSVAQSKFSKIPNFGEWSNGHILLQEHGTRVHFRNIKIRELPPN